MSQVIETIAVLGLGKVGTLAALLLHESGFQVTGLDVQLPPEALAFQTQQADLSDRAALTEALEGKDAVFSCLPYHLNLNVAKIAHQKGMHYFDLTEDVPTTKAILEMSKTAKGVMVPQCGLAPGFIGIVGAHLATLFDDIRSIKLRVGALPQHPTGLLGYAFNWSPEGVVNEYLNDCEVIENGVHKWVSPLEWLETIYIDGLQLEAFTTSGGLGTMCETYLGQVDNLDYKTMRYPGHAQLMNFLFHELLLRERRQEAGEFLTHAKPPVDEDVVYVHASVEGEVAGRLQRKEYVRSYYPREIAGQMWRAISWTTSASACAVIELVNKGVLPQQGFIKQESIPLPAFLSTTNGQHYETAKPRR